jgi:tyrosyl-tRNA synthetase
LQVVEGNPCLEYVRLIVLPWFNSLEIKRPESNGGDKVFTSMEEIEADFASGALHPGDEMLIL